jgi:hypothetical protein
MKRNKKRDDNPETLHGINLEIFSKLSTSLLIMKYFFFNNSTNWQHCYGLSLRSVV